MPSLSSARRNRSGEGRAREAAKAAKQRASWDQMKAAVVAKYERGGADA